MTRASVGKLFTRSAIPFFFSFVFCLYFFPLLGSEIQIGQRTRIVISSRRVAGDAICSAHEEKMDTADRLSIRFVNSIGHVDFSRGLFRRARMRSRGRESRGGPGGQLLGDACLFFMLHFSVVSNVLLCWKPPR